MGSSIKGCSTKEAGTALDLPLTCLVTNIKENIEKAYEKARVYSKLMMERGMKEVGTITKCMVEGEKPFIMVSAL